MLQASTLAGKTISDWGTERKKGVSELSELKQAPKCHNGAVQAESRGFRGLEHGAGKSGGRACLGGAAVVVQRIVRQQSRVSEGWKGAHGYRTCLGGAAVVVQRVVRQQSRVSEGWKGAHGYRDVPGWRGGSSAARSAAAEQGFRGLEGERMDTGRAWVARR